MMDSRKNSKFSVVLLKPATTTTSARAGGSRLDDAFSLVASFADEVADLDPEN